MARVRFATVGLLLLLLASAPLAQRRLIVLQAAQIAGITATTTTRTTTLLPAVAGYQTLDILINITAGGTATATLQLFLQDSADGGTTWDDLVSSNTFAFGASVTTQRFRISPFLVPSSIGTATLTNLTQGSAVVVESMTAATARQGPIGDRIRVREKVSSVSGTPVGPTYTITAVVR